jgi:hypothetical protein
MATIEGNPPHCEELKGSPLQGPEEKTRYISGKRMIIIQMKLSSCQMLSSGGIIKSLEHLVALSSG